VLAACASAPAGPAFIKSSHPGCETAESCEERCSKGDAAACGVMGVAARSNQGVPGGAQAALKYFRQGCEGGDGRSCANLGYAYNHGTLMEPDQAKAAHYFEEACNKGFVLGCKDLGMMYRAGRGVTRDAARAIELFQMACQKGASVGCSSLALMMPDKLVPEELAATALPMLVADCDPDRNPDPGVCTAAARLYEAGRGTPKDLGRAAQLFAAACKRGDESACKPH